MEGLDGGLDGGSGWRAWVEGLDGGLGGGLGGGPGGRASMVEDHSEQFGCCLSSLQGVLYRRIVYLDYLAK